MKKLIWIFLLVFCSTVLVYGQKARFGQSAEKAKPGVDYPLLIHLSASHIRYFCTDSLMTRINCGYGLYADASLNGRKLELLGSALIDAQDSVVLMPGDYRARIAKDIHTASDSAIHQEYEIILPDRTIWHSVVTGISE